ncbi:MAG: penicillin-binding protein 2 [Planctomycetes bacterium]|nr:penicillin-binding protein 2 [Planctomycetota bacterium]
MGRRAESAENRSARLRGYFVAAMLFTLLSVLGARLVWIQALAGERLDERALRQHARYENLTARPGSVLDVRGRLLATSAEVASAFVDPKAIDEAKRGEVAQSLAVALGLDEGKLLERLERNADKRFLWVRRRLSDDDLRAVRDLHWPAHWVGFRTELERSYPQGPLASHVVGIRDIDGVGRDGIERLFDPMLHGQTGYRVATRDARGKLLAIPEHLIRQPQSGSSVVLTIDSVVQTYVETALDQVMADWKPVSASAIVMDPRTGEILALANRPAFDPDDVSAASADAWVNRAISDSYEPGSTFKPFIMAAALDWQVIKPDEKIHCHNGAYRMGPRLLHSHHPNGELTVPEIIIRSDNIGMAIIGERLTNDGLFHAVQSFGFGRATGIELPGESPGLVRPLRDWRPYYSAGSVPMGQELAVTPIQLITAFCALANGGELLRPRVVRAVVGPDGKTVQVFDKPVVVSHPIRTETAQFMLDPVLRGVVGNEHGTGRRAELVGYSVFGKTGTAQKQSDQGGYAAGHHISSFVAGAPISDPQVIALVVVNDPSAGKEHYGGQVAAPAVAEILRHTLVYLRVPPDREIAAKPKSKARMRYSD